MLTRGGEGISKAPKELLFLRELICTKPLVPLLGKRAQSTFGTRAKNSVLGIVCPIRQYWHSLEMTGLGTTPLPPERQPQQLPQAWPKLIRKLKLKKEFTVFRIFWSFKSFFQNHDYFCLQWQIVISKTRLHPGDWGMTIRSPRPAWAKDGTMSQSVKN